MPTTKHSRGELDLAKVDWRRVDATGDEDIAHQAAEDQDTAPVFTAADLLAAGRRIERVLKCKSLEERTPNTADTPLNRPASTTRPRRSR